MDKKDKYEKYVQLLVANKNIILAGAPGTGKTFMAREIAKELITNAISCNKYYNDDYREATHNCLALKKILDTQIMMVQFHPSYDYTDFVEGLRPIKNDDGQIGFKHSNGVFKTFCKNPYNRYVVKEKSNADINANKSLVRSLDDLYYDCYKSAIDDMLSGYISWSHFSVTVPESVVSRYFSLKYQSDEDEGYYIVDDETSWEDDPILSSELFCKVIQSYDDIFNEQYPSKESIKENLIKMWSKQSPDNKWKQRNSIFDIEALDSSCPISNIEGVTDFYYTLFYWIIYCAICHYEREYLPSVFIIDEINRGEISKIFGELFFSIDPGYRGEFDANWNDNKVQTQYQNMIEEGDMFKYGFYVPENVYIIGTMNDIDRSVEDMDFAMQRRFAKIEVTAEESYQNIIAESKDFSDDEKKEIKARMTALNNAILEPELGLGEAYQIGAAYFRKLLYYKGSGIEQAFSKLWDYHLKGLLSEYLRGNHNSKTQLETLKAAYDNKVTKHEESNQDNG